MIQLGLNVILSIPGVNFVVRLLPFIEGYFSVIIGEMVPNWEPTTAQQPFQRPVDPCTCPVCGKWFQKAFLVKRHMLVHTGEKPFRCDYCGKRFTQKANQQKHTLIHYKKFTVGITH